MHKIDSNQGSPACTISNTPNILQISYRVIGQGWTGSHKVVGKGYVFTKNSQMASIGAIFTSTYQTKQLIHAQTHQPVVWWITAAVCLSREYGVIWKWPEHLWMSDKPQKQDTTKAAWATFSIITWLKCYIIVNVYSYCLIVKSVSMLCAWKAAFLKSGHIYSCLL